MIELTSFQGQVLDGKYRLEALLGKGGMGAVFRATHLGTDRVVALKLIVPGLMEQQDFIARFQREARATGRLRHPNIVDLTDFGFADTVGGKLAYLVMEYLEGETLKDLLRANPTPPIPFVADVLQQICSALQEAHDKGIVHRDLKPDNLWMEPNRRGGLTVKILDFGLAKIYDPKARAEGRPGLPEEDRETVSLAPSLVLTQALTPAAQAPPGQDPLQTEVGTRLGTPAYMSPEQCRAAPLDHRSDLYSLGVIAYQMLSGRTPFQGGSLELLNQHIQSAVPPLEEFRKDLPEGACALVMAAMEKDPAQRPQSAETFGEAFAAYCETPFKVLRVVLDVVNQHGRAVYTISLLGHSLAILMGAIYLAASLTMIVLTRHGPPISVTAPLVAAWGIGLFLGMTLNASCLPPVLFHGLALPLKVVHVRQLLERSRPRILEHLRFNLRMLALGCGILALFGAIMHGQDLQEAEQSRALLPNLFQRGLILLARPVAAISSLGAAFLFAGYFFRDLPRLGLVPPILNVEDCSWDEALARSRSLKKNPLGRFRQPSSTAGKVAIVGVLLAFAMISGLAGAVLVRSFSAGESSWLAPWMLPLTVLGVTLLSVLAAPIAELSVGYRYLLLRRMCRESLSKAFLDLRRRLEGREVNT